MFMQIYILLDIFKVIKEVESKLRLVLPIKYYNVHFTLNILPIFAIYIIFICILKIFTILKYYTNA